ncbi:hypothetical protein ABT093_02380 [Kitasatospora sp. NPDC002551]
MLKARRIAVSAFLLGIAMLIGVGSATAEDSHWGAEQRQVAMLDMDSHW